MDQDEILSQLFELASQMNTFTIGALMRPGRLSSEAAFEETRPLREALIRLYEAAGRPVPVYLRPNLEGT
jgi:hypothetical protein